ncbi:MAG: nucleotidyltransferase family protein [Candidatus Micrarchaeota archaeon]|nr:nucleotidyltransferase family protein [Candidatus Micrarchaeota archaeon]
MDFMKAVLLAGGLGKRLRPLTDRVPKPLVEVGGKPIIEWQILWLRSLGVDSFVILAGYLSEKIKEYIDERKGSWKVTVDYSIEKEPLGTGGAIKNAKGFLKDEKEFYVLNGDNITNVDISKLELDSGMASIALAPLRSTYGVVNVDGEGNVTRFDEKPLIEDYWMNAGVYRMRNEVLQHLPDNGAIEKTTFVELSSKGALRGVKFADCYFHGVDSVKDVEEVSADLAAGRVYKGV